MKNYALYDSDGRIKQIGTCPDHCVQSQARDGLGVVEAEAYSWDFWVDMSLDPPTIKPKTSSPHSINKLTCVADGVDMISITGLHNPTTVTWPDGVVTEETDGTAEFTVDLAGDYAVTLEAVPYLKEVINVTATDPA